MPKPNDVKLYGKASAAQYLGVSEVWLEQLVRGLRTVGNETVLNRPRMKLSTKGESHDHALEL